MESQVEGKRLECPAKLNLNLAVRGLRGDGFHELVSVVARVAWADTLELWWEATADAEDSLEVEGGDCGPVEKNSVLAAVRLWRREAKEVPGGRVVGRLRKRIPSGAGLGGGSSDAAGCWRILQSWWPQSLRPAQWAQLPEELGSDVPFFLREGVQLMEGRGERLRRIPEDLEQRLAGCRMVIWKPPFAVATAAAYGQIRERRCYEADADGDPMLELWRAAGTELPPEKNAFEEALRAWMPAIPAMLSRLRRRYGMDARLSGSGSACFAIAHREHGIHARVEREMRELCGQEFRIIASPVQFSLASVETLYPNKLFSPRNPI